MIDITKNQTGKENKTVKIPSAKEILKETKKSWSVLSEEQILRKIEMKVAQGERKASFFSACISKETKKKLRKLGYKVHVYKEVIISGEPWFVVRW